MGRARNTLAAVAAVDGFIAIFGQKRGLDEATFQEREREEKEAVVAARAHKRKDRAEREARAKALAPQNFDVDGYVFETGDAYEYPDDDGRIRVRDEHGNCFDYWDVDDDGWQERANLFGNIPEDFVDDDEDEDC
jgi:hypothetical protein